MLAAEHDSTVQRIGAKLDADPVDLNTLDELIEVARTYGVERSLSHRLSAIGHRVLRRLDGSPGAPRASFALERLSLVFEALGEAGSAIAALRLGLRVERLSSQQLGLSTEQPPDSSFRSRESSHPETTRTFVHSFAPDTIPSPVPSASRLEPRPTGSGEHPKAADLLLLVIEHLQALRTQDDVVEAAALVLKTSLDAIAAVSGFVHVMDLTTRDYVIIAASGTTSTEVVGMRTRENDPLIELAARKMSAVVALAGDRRLEGNRFRVSSPLRSVLCAPVHFDGRILGALELIDPASPDGFGIAAMHAMTYVGERFAEFLADRDTTF